MHAIQKLYQIRKAQSTKAFRARGATVNRCVNCQIDKDFCICQWRKLSDAQAGFLLLMHDFEVLKPSNTGRLIADVIPETHAFIWSRTQADEKLLTLLTDPIWQPIIIFPAIYATSEQRVLKSKECLEQYIGSAKTTKKPLFILLDGTWREAKKMFRKSEYLNKFPVLSIEQNALSEHNNAIFLKRYHVRKAVNDEQLATAEVAAKVLALYGEIKPALHLDLWFDLFSYHYQRGVKQTNKGDENALSHYLDFIDEIT